MVRLSDMHEEDALHLREKRCEAFATQPWVQPPALKGMRLAIVTTAGLQLRDDPAFEVCTPDYRVIPGDVDANNLVMSHSSVNFDRSGFQEDVNIAFPIDRFRELVSDGVIGSLADYHYSFMSAFIEPEAFEPSASDVAANLKKDRVDAVFLVPI